MMGFQAAGFNKVLQNLARVTPAVIAELATAIELVQNKVEGHAKGRHKAAREKMRGSGKTRIVPSKGGKNRLKNPDGTPRYGDRLGRLTGSIRAVPVKQKAGLLHGFVRAGTGTQVNYAAHVEFGGTISRNRSARAGSSAVVGFRKPHPFMRPALKHGKEWERSNSIFRNAVNRGMKQAVK